MRLRALALAGALALFATPWVAGCQRREPAFVDAKAFALSPEESVGAELAVKGRVVREGPAGAWFELEDDTGRVLVSTERLVGRVSCPVGAQAAAEGVLRGLRGGRGLYFSMHSLLHCRP